MGLFDRFKKQPAPQGRVVDPAGARTGREIVGTSLRTGMWVMCELEGRHEPGIVVALDEGTNLLHIMLVDPAVGENRIAVLTGRGSVRQARFAEIPAARRPTQEAGAALGYA